ncbi:MAG: leucine-rich repeat domain-containing protein [Ruminococcaceae bacterium]|nr:leucine-rich repeat domain-containing protein [Oscillospiraceae bacterium]
MKRFITLLFMILLCSLILCGCGASCEHEYGDYKIDVYPTDMDDGSRTRTCAKCGNTETEAFSASVGLDLFYREEENLYVLQGIGECTDAVIVIPRAYVTHDAEYTVVVISSDAFKGCKYIREVIIPEGVRVIGNRAFNYCPSLKKVHIPSTVERIGPEVFNSSANVEIDVSEDNPYYSGKGNCLVEKASGTLISGFNSSVIPDDLGIKKIAPFAFYKCNELKEITIPESVTEIGEEAFAWCETLTKATVKGAETIGYSAFGYCYALESVELPKNLKTIGAAAFTHAAIRELVIPEGTERIEQSAFSHCEKLETVDMADSVTFIGTSAFGNCHKLSRIELPADLTEIGTFAFYQCTSLRSLTIPSGVRNVKEQTFAGCASLLSVTALGAESIGNSAFAGCYRLAEIALPKTLKKIDGSAFYNCGAITSVSFEGTKTEWEAVANDDRQLKTLTVKCADGNVEASN